MTSLDSLLVTYVVDCSGSTASNCIDTKVMNRTCPLIDFEKYTVKAGLIALAHVTSPSRCSMYASCFRFNDQVYGVFGPTKVDYGNVQDLLGAVGALQAGGLTNFDVPLDAAITQARAFVKEKRLSAAHIFILTDGKGDYTQGSMFMRAIEDLPISVHVVGLGYAAERRACAEMSNDLGGLFLYGNKADNYLNTIQHSHARIIHDAANGIPRLLTRRFTGPERVLFDEVSLCVSAMAAANDHYATWHATGAAGRLVEAFKRAPAPHCDNTVEMGKAVASADAFSRWGSKAISVWLSEFKYGFCGTVLNKTTLEFTSVTVNLVLALIMDTQQYYDPVPGNYIKYKQDEYGNVRKDLSGQPIPWEAEVDESYFDTPQQAAAYQAKKTAEARHAADNNVVVKATQLKVDEPGGCFSEHTVVNIYAGGVSRFKCRAGDLRAGDRVVSSNGTGTDIAVVEAVFVSPAASKTKVHLRNVHMSLVITDNHPIKNDHQSKWIWAKDSTDVVEPVLDRPEDAEDTIISVMFNDHSHSRGCRSLIAGPFHIIAAGHEIQDDPVATHSFWGSRQALRAYIAEVYPEGLPKDGIVRMKTAQE